MADGTFGGASAAPERLLAAVVNPGQASPGSRAISRRRRQGKIPDLRAKPSAWSYLQAFPSRVSRPRTPSSTQAARAFPTSIESTCRSSLDSWAIISPPAAVQSVLLASPLGDPDTYLPLPRQSSEELGDREVRRRRFSPYAHLWGLGGSGVGLPDGARPDATSGHVGGLGRVLGSR